MTVKVSISCFWTNRCASTVKWLSKQELRHWTSLYAFLCCWVRIERLWTVFHARVFHRVRIPALRTIPHTISCRNVSVRIIRALLNTDSSGVICKSSIRLVVANSQTNSSHVVGISKGNHWTLNHAIFGAVVSVSGIHKRRIRASRNTFVGFIVCIIDLLRWTVR